MLPSFVGIGAPKAGTTWLATCLAEHPDVFVAACKETNFFDYATIEGRLEEYEAHFLGSEKAKAVGEVSTRYLASANAAERAWSTIPEARLFVSLRNPVEQVYSHYWHLRRQNFHQWNGSDLPASLDEALERYPARLLAPVSYATHLDRWLQSFDRSQLLIVFYDEIKSDPRSVLRRVYAHVGVDASFAPASLAETGSAVRRGVSPRSGTHARVHSRVYGFLSREVYYRLKRTIGTSRAHRIKEALRARQVLERVFFREGYPELAADTRASLRARFRDEIGSLEALTGKSLEHWR